MGRNIRDRREPNKRVVHITNRVWEGLPFVPNILTNRIIKGVLARAQTLFKVNIVAYLFMTNHYHIIIAGDANRVSKFMGYLDGELAKKFKKIMPGRWGPKFWSDRFKEELLATDEDVINKICYIFTNPIKANLVSSIKDYPGVSSIKSLYNYNYHTRDLCSFTFMRYLKPLNSMKPTQTELMSIVKYLQQKASYLLALESNLLSWTSLVKSARSKDSIIFEIVKRIKESEDVASENKVIGKEKLVKQSYALNHKPKNKGITVFVECCDVELRKTLISSYNNFRRLCTEAWQKTKQGIKTDWPIGANKPVMLVNYYSYQR